MVTGVTGANGLDAPNHVDLEKETEEGNVTTRFQLMVAQTVRDQAMSLKYVATPVVYYRAQYHHVKVTVYVSMFDMTAYLLS